MTLPVIERPQALRGEVRAWRGGGETIALVPTMGDLHAGHLALVEAARARADRLVVSVFVNPLQFGADEDYADYPRALERDRQRLAAYGADLVYAPDTETVYPRGLDRTVRLHAPELEDVLCGADRPGHFTGVATIVAKLFNAAEPDIAVFGEKDYQQLLLIRRLAEDLDFGVEVMGVPTVREADGVALSSRNSYLTQAERAAAPTLYATLRALSDRLLAGERHFQRLEADARAQLVAAGFRPSYVAVRRAWDLREPMPEDEPGALRILAAAHLGAARLIDNVAGDEGNR